MLTICAQLSFSWFLPEVCTKHKIGLGLSDPSFLCVLLTEMAVGIQKFSASLLGSTRWGGWEVLSALLQGEVAAGLCEMRSCSWNSRGQD